MINRAIRGLTLAGTMVNTVFKNVTVLLEGWDNSLVATLRALLCNRVSPQERVTFQLKCITVDSHGGDHPTLYFHNNLYKQYFESNCVNCVTIISLYRNECDTKLMEYMLGRECAQINNYRRDESLALFYKKHFSGLFFLNEQANSAVIFVSNFSFKILHALQMMIPRYIPSFFKDKPLTEDETALLKSLGEPDETQYVKLIEEFAVKICVRSDYIRQELEGFMTQSIKSKIAKMEDLLLSLEADFEGTLERLDSLQVSINRTKEHLAGLFCQSANKENDREIMDCFLTHKPLHLVETHEDRIEFIVKTYANIYDEDAFSCYVSNPYSFLYTIIEEDQRGDMELLYRSIFENRTYELRMCAAYSFSLQAGIRPLPSYHFDVSYDTYLPNPHIQNFGCVGSFAACFQNYHNKEDYAGEFEGAIMSTQNLNFHDSAVMETFSEILHTTSAKCLEAKDGKLLSPQDAIKELKSWQNQ